MKRFLLASLLVALFFLGMFGVLTVADLRVDEVVSGLDAPTPLTAMISIALLASDFIAPVPTTVLMALNGWLFGFVLGACISLIGALLGFFIAFVLGRRGHGLYSTFLGTDGVDHSTNFWDRSGFLLIVVSRPVPIVAETTAVIAGASGITYRKAGAAAITGLLPTAMIFASVGSESPSLIHSSVAFLAVMLVALAIWRAATWTKQKRTST